jgi:hypothetical protein
MASDAQCQPPPVGSGWVGHWLKDPDCHQKKHAFATLGVLVTKMGQPQKLGLGSAQKCKKGALNHFPKTHHWLTNTCCFLFLESAAKNQSQEAVVYVVANCDGSN